MLRPNQPANGLVLANGGFATYQDVMIFSSQPSKVTDWTYPARNPLPEEITDVEAPEVDDEVGAEQEAIIEVSDSGRGKEAKFGLGLFCPQTPHPPIILLLKQKSRLTRSNSRATINHCAATSSAVSNTTTIASSRTTPMPPPWASWPVGT